MTRRANPARWERQRRQVLRKLRQAPRVWSKGGKWWASCLPY